MTKERFGAWTVQSTERRGARNILYANCVCDCGTARFVRMSNLRAGLTNSCGCKRFRTHGKRGSRIYSIWASMKQRCENPKAQSYDRYGGRGISVDAEWSASFEAFFRDMGADHVDGATLDRIDNDGPYALENCRWASRKEQARNRGNNIVVTFEGEPTSLAEAAERANLPYAVVSARLSRYGWTVDRALSEPVAPRKPRIR